MLQRRNFQADPATCDTGVGLRGSLPKHVIINLSNIYLPWYGELDHYYMFSGSKIFNIPDLEVENLTSSDFNTGIVFKWFASITAMVMAHFSISVPESLSPFV